MTTLHPDTTTYRQAAFQLLDQAQAELAAGDIRQASEKGWGAAALIIKAVAQHHGRRHDSHRSLFVNIRRLISETGDRQLSLLFASANFLHTTFYEFDTLEHISDADTVSLHLEQVRQLVHALDAILT